MSITKTATFSVTVLAVLLLTACEAAPPAQEDMQPEKQTIDEQQGEVLQPTTGGETETEEFIPVPPLVSQEDWTLYTGALQLMDESYCQQISDENLRDQCGAEIEKRRIIGSAVENQDASLCNNLEETKAKICRMEVELAQKRIDDMRDPTPEEREIMNRAQENEDVSICDEIESSRKRENCQTNVELIMKIKSGEFSY